MNQTIFILQNKNKDIVNVSNDLNEIYKYIKECTPYLKMSETTEFTNELKIYDKTMKEPVWIIKAFYNI